MTGPGASRDWVESCDFVRLGEVVARLKREVEIAYYYCRDEDAAAAHRDLIRAEWRLRQAERRRR